MPKLSTDPHRRVDPQPPLDAERILDAYQLHQRRRNLSEDTIANDRTLLNAWAQHLRGSLWSATKEDVWSFLDPNHAAGTNAWKLSRMSSFYKWAIIEELCDADPTMKVERPKVPKRLPRPASPEDVAAELERADTRTRAMLALGAFCGLRAVEVWRCRGEDFTDDGWLLVHGKGGKERLVPIPTVAREILDKNGVPPYGPVFWTLDRSRPLGRQSMRVMLNRWLKRFTFHQLRHAFLTLFHEESGHDLALTSEIAGHSHLETTRGYVRLRTERAGGVVDAVSRHYERLAQESSKPVGHHMPPLIIPEGSAEPSAAADATGAGS